MTAREAIREMGWRYCAVTLIGALYCLLVPRMYYRDR